MNNNSSRLIMWTISTGLPRIHRCVKAISIKYFKQKRKMPNRNELRKLEASQPNSEKRRRNPPPGKCRTGELENGGEGRGKGFTWRCRPDRALQIEGNEWEMEMGMGEREGVGLALSSRQGVANIEGRVGN